MPSRPPPITPPLNDPPASHINAPCRMPKRKLHTKAGNAHIHCQVPCNMSAVKKAIKHTHTFKIVKCSNVYKYTHSTWAWACALKKKKKTHLSVMTVYFSRSTYFPANGLLRAHTQIPCLCIYIALVLYMQTQHVVSCSPSAISRICMQLYEKFVFHSLTLSSPVC